MRTKWTDEKVRQVVQECRAAGREYAEIRLANLRKQGPKYAVCQNTIAGRQAVDTMMDVCGFAWLHIPARGGFYLRAKRLSQAEPNLRIYCTRGYGGGGMFDVFDCTHRQEMSVNIAAMTACKNVLAKYGVDATVRSRID